MNLSGQTTILPNGLRILTSTIPEAQSAALGIWVGVGGRHESRPISGISHFIEHMLFKGTTRRSARDITRAIEGRGGDFNAFTQEDSTCYYARMAATHVWDILEVLTDMYLRPSFVTDDIARERDVIMEELMMTNDQPDQLVQEMLNSMLWRNHELGRPIAGIPETLRRIKRENLIAFKNKKYVAANTIFAFAGPMPHSECVKHTRRIVQKIARRPEPEYRLVTSSIGQESLRIRSKPIEQTQLALGFRLFGHFDRRRYALRLLNVVLGENMSSRLFQSVREKYGLTYSVHSSAQLFADTGVLSIAAGIDGDRIERTFTLIARELRNLKNKPIPRRELDEAREYLTGHLLLSMESPSGHMNWLGESMLNYGRIITPDEVLVAIRQVTAADVLQVANAVLTPEKCSLAILTGEKSVNGLESALQSKLSQI